MAWCGVLDRVSLTRGSLKNGLVWSFGPSRSHQGKSKEWLGVEFWTESLSSGEAPRMAWCGVLDRVALTRGSLKNGLVWSFGPSRSHQGKSKEWLGVEFWTESLSPGEV
ncbi:hypothetical protein RRG08_000060 [Elysia crispata]|uniref:Uncharacterized protein n=1 Tax=Elysia crispata TaxID=231223 RepID=A0AAE1CJM8_9GAST|nr:hypothetical protein RRG08_000060 [Elysia crispata]